MSKKNQGDYSDDFREQIAKLVISGKPIAAIVKEYGIAKATVHNWARKYKETGSFRDKDNRSTEETDADVKHVLSVFCRNFAISSSCTDEIPYSSFFYAHYRVSKGLRFLRLHFPLPNHTFTFPSQPQNQLFSKLSPNGYPGKHEPYQ